MKLLQYWEIAMQDFMTALIKQLSRNYSRMAFKCTIDSLSNRLCIKGFASRSQCTNILYILLYCSFGCSKFVSCHVCLSGSLMPLWLILNYANSDWAFCLARL